MIPEPEKAKGVVNDLWNGSSGRASFYMAFKNSIILNIPFSANISSSENFIAEDNYESNDAPTHNYIFLMI